MWSTSMVMQAMVFKSVVPLKVHSGQRLWQVLGHKELLVQLAKKSLLFVNFFNDTAQAGRLLQKSRQNLHRTCKNRGKMLDRKGAG